MRYLEYRFVPLGGNGDLTVGHLVQVDHSKSLVEKEAHDIGIALDHRIKGHLANLELLIDFELRQSFAAIFILEDGHLVAVHLCKDQIVLVYLDTNILAAGNNLVDRFEITGKDVYRLVVIVGNCHIVLADHKADRGFACLVLCLSLLRFGIELHHIPVTADQVSIVAVELDDPVVHVVHLLHMTLGQSVFDHRDRFTLTLNDEVFLLGITHTDT